MSRIMGTAVKARYMPGKVENSFYKEQRITSTTSRTYRTNYSETKILYYVESDSKEVKVKNTLLMR